MVACQEARFLGGVEGTLGNVRKVRLRKEEEEREDLKSFEIPWSHAVEELITQRRGGR